MSRWLSRGAMVLVLIAGLLGLGLVALHAPPVQKWVLRTIVERASALARGRLSMGSLDYRLWRGEAVVRDVRFEPDHEGTLASVHAGEVQVRWVPPSQVAITAFRPVVQLRGMPEDPDQEDRVVEPSVPRWISALRVLDAEIHFRGVSGGNRISMGPLDADLRADAAAGGVRGAVQVGGGSVTFGPRTIDIRRVEAEMFVAGGDVEVRARELVTEAGDVRGEGRIETVSPFVAGFDLNFRLDADRLVDVLLEDDREAIAGELQGSARLQFGEDLFASEGTAEGSGLAFRDFGPFDGEARWDLEDDLLRVDGLFRGGPSRIEVDAALDLARSEQAFTLLLDAPSMNALIEESGGPRSPWDANLHARLSARMAGFAPDTLEGQGEISLSGDELAGRIDVGAEPGRILVETRELSIPGGRATARARVTDFETVLAEYQLGISELSATIAPFLDDASGWLGGELRVSGRAAGPLGELASIRNSMRVESEDFRLRGAPFLLYARLDQRGESLDFDRLSLVTAENGTSGELSLSGEVDFERRRMEVLGSLDSFPLHRLARLEGLYATGTGNIEASGSFDGPRGAAAIDLSPLGYSGVPLPPLRLDLESDGELVNAEMTWLDSGASFATARVPLSGDYLLEGEVDLGAVPWAELATKLPSGSPELAAIAVEGDAQVRLPLTEPSLFEAEVAVEAASLAIRERVISTSGFELNVHRDAILVSGLQVLYGGEALSIDGVVGLANGADASLAIEGNVALDVAEIWLPGRDIEGAAHLDLDLSGSVREPEFYGEMTIDGARLVDGTAASDTSPSIENLRFEALAAGTVIEIETLEADILGGGLVASGTVPVPGAGAGEPARVSFDISGIDVASLATSARGSQAMTTSISIGGEVDFPEGSYDRIEASGAIQDVLLASEGGIIYLIETAEWRYDESGVSVGEVHLEGDRTDLRINVSPPGSEEGESLGVSVEGQLDLQVANAVLPDSVYLAGVASLDVEASSAGEGFRFSGDSRISEGELIVSSPAFTVTDLSAGLELDSDTLRVLDLEARAGGGTLEGEGALTIPGAGAEELVRFDIAAENVRVEYPEGMRSEVSADLALESREDGYRLSGKIDIEQAIYQRPISPARELLDALRRQTLELEGEPGLLERIDLDLAVETDRPAVVDNNLGQMRWTAGLLVTGTLAAPEASGTLQAVPGGTLSFGRNTYEIESARVELTTYPAEPPELDIRARTEVGGREIVLAVTGRTDNLRTSLESPSDPTLSRGDVASLLLTGRTLEEVRGEEVDVVGQEAATYLGSSLANLTETGLASVLPVTTVRLDPSIVGSETDPGVRFSIGRAITEDLFLTYSIGLDDPEKQLWIIDYDLPYRMSLRVIREDSNDYTGGVSQDMLFDFYERTRPKRLDELPKPKIAAVEIPGELPLPEEEVDDALSLEVGDDYDYWKAREEGDELVERLRAIGYLSARVDVFATPAEAGPEEPVTLTYEVDWGPVVGIEWSGDPVPDDLREGVIARFEGYIPPRALALRIGNQLEWELMSRNYFTATVEPVVEEYRGQVLVAFDVVLGPKGTEVEVDIEGNDNLPDEEIERLLPPPGTVAFFELVLGRTEDLREELNLLYAGEGFLASEVTELTTRFDPETSRFHVIVAVEEGERFRVGDILFSGTASLPEESLASEVQLEEGEAFQFLTHLQDRQRIAALYRREGFPDARVRSSLQPSDARVDLTFEVFEGERVRVGEIEIVGAKATRDGVIHGALTFEPGDSLKLSDLTETQSRLYNLGVFRSVDVRPEPTEEEGARDVIIDVTELPDLRFGYGARYSTEDHLEVTGDFELTNVLGTARQVGFHAFANRRLSELRATVNVPSFFGRDVGSTFYVARETEEGEGFESRAWSATFQQGRRIFSSVLAQWSFTHRQSSVTETVSSGPFGFDIEADRSVLSFSLIEDTRSSLTHPRSGRFWNATLQYAPEFLGSDLRFIKLYGQFFLYKTIWKDVVWASTYRAGIANGFSQVLLPTDRFRAGGPSSVRGYPVNELGPPDPITGAVIGGEGVVIMNQELRFPLFWRFGGITFYDAGNVFLSGSDFNPIDLRHTTGFGLSVELPVGLVTVDWAVLLNPPPELPKTRWHFTFGYSF